MFGCSHEELIGSAAQSIVPGLHAGPTIATHAGPEITALELRALRPDGSEFPVGILLNRICFEARIATIAFITDQTETDVSYLNDQEFSRVTRASTLGELAGSIAHELNRPLTAILSNSQAGRRLLDRIPLDVAEIRDILKDIVEDSVRAGEVIKRIHAFAKREKPELVALDLASVVRDVVRLFRHDTIVRNIPLTMDIDDSVPVVRGDRVQLQQVFVNLLSNAFDAVECQGLNDRRIRVSVERYQNGFVRVSVKDNGPGPGINDLDTIFKPFFTSKPNGLGLGLSITRTIVRIHGGDLWAERNVDCGMTFYITLPAG
jgi:two-component system sensor kinase FixL